MHSDRIGSDSVNGVFPSTTVTRRPARRPISVTLPWQQQSNVKSSISASYGGFPCVSLNTGTCDGPLFFVGVLKLQFKAT